MMTATQKRELSKTVEMPIITTAQLAAEYEAEWAAHSYAVAAYCPRGLETARTSAATMVDLPAITEN